MAQDEAVRKPRRHDGKAAVPGEDPDWRQQGEQKMAAEPTMLPGSAPRLLDGLLDPTVRDPEFHVMAGGTIAIAGLLALLLVLVDGLSAPLASHLFYLPVMLGALVYGWRGGVTVALVAGLLAAVIARGVTPAPVASPVAGLLPVAVQIVLGFALGGLADAVRDHLRRALLEAPGPAPVKGCVG